MPTTLIAGVESCGNGGSAMTRMALKGSIHSHGKSYEFVNNLLL